MHFGYNNIKFEKNEMVRQMGCQIDGARGLEEFQKDSMWEISFSKEFMRLVFLHIFHRRSHSPISHLEFGWPLNTLLTHRIRMGWILMALESFAFFFFFVFLPFLRLLPRHMEVPRLGVQSEL